MQPTDRSVTRIATPRPSDTRSLGEQERADLLGLLDDAQRLVRTSGSDVLGDAGDPATATAALRELWHVVVGAVHGAVGAGGDGVAAVSSSRDLVDLLSRIKRLDDAVQSVEAQKRTQRLESVRHALGRLQSAESVAGLVAITPEVVCDLGFSRSLLSSIDDALWVAQSGHIPGDPGWTAEIVDVGRKSPQRIVPGLREAETVRHRRPLLVRDAASDTGVHRALVEASRTRSYVAVPVVAGKSVVGLLHADRLDDTQDVDEFDRSVLALFSDGLTYALDRVVMLDRLDSLRSDLAQPEVSTGCVRTASSLTRRELEVMDLMAAGLSNRCIADRLVVSDATVKSHVKHILRKLHASNRAEAVSRWLTGRAHRTMGSVVVLRAESTRPLAATAVGQG